MINATSLDYQNNMEQVEQMPKRLPILIIDDEPVAVNLLEDFVKKINYLELEASYSDAGDALQFLEQHEVDILITDVQMPDINGLDLVKSLTSPPVTIFVSAHRDFAADGFETDAVDYLLKPVTFSRFEKAVNKARNFIHLPSEAGKSAITQDPFLFVKTDDGYTKILLDDIAYFQAKGDYVLMVKREKKDILWRITMSDLEKRLSPVHFICTHRSYIINVNNILSVFPARIELTNHLEIPLSKFYKPELEKRIGIK